jgi:hypothetical protein
MGVGLDRTREGAPMIIVRMKDGQTVQVDGGSYVRTHARRPNDPPTFGAGDAREVLLVYDIAGDILGEFDRVKVSEYVIT